MINDEKQTLLSTWLLKSMYSNDFLDWRSSDPVPVVSVLADDAFKSSSDMDF